MAYLHTIQNAYVPLRSSEVTVADVPMDSTTANSTLWDYTRYDEFKLGEEANGIEVFFAGEMTDGATDTCHIYGRSPTGPAEKIAEVSLTAGSAFFKGRVPGGTAAVDSSTYLMIDTINCDTTNEFHIKNISFYDSGNNRVGKMIFDGAGLEYLIFCFTQTASANSPTRITPYGRAW